MYNLNNFLGDDSMKLKRLVFLPVLFFSVVSMASQKIGYVDVQRAILSTKAGKAAKKKIEAEVGKRKKSLDKNRTAVEKMQKHFQKKSLVLTDQAKNKKMAEIQREGMKLQELYMKMQKELQKKERDLQEPILKSLKAAIEKIAKSEKYDVVLEKSQSLLWASKSIDLTSKVVKEFEKIHKN